MEQKIIQIGNSTGVILPKSLLAKAGLKPGTKVVIEEDAGSDSLIISKMGSKNHRSSLTPQFMEMLEKVNKHYGSALRELARR